MIILKKIIRIILCITGLLLIIAFFATILHDYYLMQTKIYAMPLGLEFTVILSGIIFLVPGIICLIVSYFMKRKEIKNISSKL
jgi:hypothetical protein